MENSTKTNLNIQLKDKEIVKNRQNNLQIKKYYKKYSKRKNSYSSSSSNTRLKKVEKMYLKCDFILNFQIDF